MYMRSLRWHGRIRRSAHHRLRPARRLAARVGRAISLPRLRRQRARTDRSRADHARRFRGVLRMALTPEQHARRDGKIGASFIPYLMAGNEAKLLSEWRRLVGDPEYVEEDLSDVWLPSFG